RLRIATLPQDAGEDIHADGRLRVLFPVEGRPHGQALAGHGFGLVVAALVAKDLGEVGEADSDLRMRGAVEYPGSCQDRAVARLRLSIIMIESMLEPRKVAQAAHLLGRAATGDALPHADGFAEVGF